MLNGLDTFDESVTNIFLKDIVPVVFHKQKNYQDLKQ